MDNIKGKQNRREMVKKTNKMRLLEQQLNEPIEDYISRRYFDDYCSKREIAKELGVDYSQFRLWIKKLNIDVDSRIIPFAGTRVPKRKTERMIEAEQKLGEPLKDYLRRRYIDEWSTVNRIARNLGVDYSQMKLWFKFFDIKIRSTGKVRRLEKIVFTENQKQIIYGSLLGDGCLFHPSGCTQCAFNERHSEKQEEYIRWKAEHLHSLKPVLTSIYDESNFEGAEYCWVLQTASCKFFTNLHKEMYRPATKKDYERGLSQRVKNVKIVTREHLERLTPLGIAVWVMDDGSITRAHNGYAEWRIYTNGFSSEDLKIIFSYFKEVYNLHPTFCKSKGGRVTRFKGSDTLKLMEMTKEYFPECMRYKLGGV